MAYAAVASLLQTIDTLLHHHQPSISPHFRNQIVSIHQHTRFLQSFIEGSSDRVNNWEETIREATNRAEDIMELLLSDSLLRSSIRSSRSDELERGKYEISYSFDELEKVRKQIESIVSRVKGGRRIATPNGSDDEVMEIVSRLRGGSTSLERIAICGSGGMGKSTLARKAYHHPLIVQHFDVRAGAPFTREFTWAGVVDVLLRSMRTEFSGSNSEDELIQRFLQIIGRRRYLILVDDVWSFGVLERLKRMLPDYGNGSRIIFTTRSSDLAKSANHVHEMCLLDEEKSWNVLREKVFKGDPCPFQLESVGKAIAGSCRGHPLSIAVVAGILVASDQTEAVWEDFAENIKIAVDKVDEILHLSYVYLPRHLRPCFLFLGTFPHGLRIYVSELVRLWVAEGFVNKSTGSKSLEETGEEYVEDLVNRSLVSVTTWKSNGRIKIINVHDLILGMCLKQAHIDNFSLRFDRIRPLVEVKDIIKSCRRASGLDGCDDLLSGVYGSTIRTLLLASKNNGKVDLRCWMGNVRLLRILYILNIPNYNVSSEVFELFHLRYLTFGCDSSIPEAISNLLNLQTLYICRTKGGIYDKLPEGIWRMPQLRHLYIISFEFPIHKEPTSALQNLQTLSRVVDFVCSRENLESFPNLKSLDLIYTNKLRDVVEDCELRNLIHLHKLEVLKLRSNLSFGEERKMRRATFPLTLKKLSLRGLHLPWEDMKIIGSLPNLEVLKLRNHACVGDTWETSEGGFPRLVYLRIEGTHMKNWITKSSHFPRLWQLALLRCSSLLEVPYEMVRIPTLKVICLDDKNLHLRRSAERIRHGRHRLGHGPLYIGML